MTIDFNRWWVHVGFWATITIAVAVILLSYHSGYQNAKEGVEKIAIQNNVAFFEPKTGKLIWATNPPVKIK